VCIATYFSFCRFRRFLVGYRLGVWAFDCLGTDCFGFVTDCFVF